MEKYKLVRGSISPKLAECINLALSKWRVRWNIRSVEVSNNISEETRIEYQYYEAEFIHHKPNIDEIKELVFESMNAEIDQKILEGFVWKDMPVWLSSENQFNYKAAYDLAMMSQGKNLPTTFKFGATNSPLYYKFETLEDISDFYLSAMTYINNCLTEGWEAKDSVDWSAYSVALDE